MSLALRLHRTQQLKLSLRGVDWPRNYSSFPLKSTFKQLKHLQANMGPHNRSSAASTNSADSKRKNTDTHEARSAPTSPTARPSNKAEPDASPAQPATASSLWSGLFSILWNSSTLLNTSSGRRPSIPEVFNNRIEFDRDEFVIDLGVLYEKYDTLLQELKEQYVKIQDLQKDKTTAESRITKLQKQAEEVSTRDTKLRQSLTKRNNDVKEYQNCLLTLKSLMGKAEKEAAGHESD
ncbi:hypothetical protein LTR64_001873 [Lithohypha guttulata]|uniref:uncharacterized protein n=1 Tax=Lithohypha guttulata TaxID=1690604 RepID=UPI002DE00333|nr:hypothetical protein LTR51_007732 [Lithohypha guttulata]